MSNNLEFAEIIYLENDKIKYINCKNKFGLNAMISILKQNLTETNIFFLDLHNVTDLFSHDEYISSHQICVLSFVGRGGKIRNYAREDIAQRILKKQVTIGIMVFERPKLKHIEKSTTINDVIGTKAWTIYYINYYLVNRQFYFVDDSSDHIEITNKYLKHKKNIHSYLVNGTKEDVQNTIKNINKSI